MSVPGASVPGVYAIGQFDDDSSIAAGVTITTTISLSVVGVATGGATVAGQVLSTGVAIIAGTATGGALIAGATIAVQASVIAGSAFVDAMAPGELLTLTAALLEGSATGDANCDGALLEVALSIDAGSAQGGIAGDGIAFGSLLEVVSTIAAGVAIGDANVSGDLLEVVSTIDGGSATGDANADGQTLTVYAALMAGQAAGGQVTQRVAGVGPGYRKAPDTIDGFAFGTVVAARVSVEGGRADGGEQSRDLGDVIARPEYARPRATPDFVLVVNERVDATAPAALIGCRVTIESGSASVDWTEYDNALMLLVA